MEDNGNSLKCLLYKNEVIFRNSTDNGENIQSVRVRKDLKELRWDLAGNAQYLVVFCLLWGPGVGKSLNIL